MWISGRLTTAREPRERGCSGSEMVEMRSVGANQSEDLTQVSKSSLQIVYGLTVDLLLVYRLNCIFIVTF